MSIEKDILLFNAQNEHQKALVNIAYTYYFLVDKMTCTFKRYDITRQQFSVLHILKSQLPKLASVNFIKARMIDKMSDVSRIVERLRIKGLVVRESAEKDKRSVHVIITQKGVDLLTMMAPEIDDLGQLLNNLSQGETLLLNTLLDKVRMKKAVSATHDFAGQAFPAPAFTEID